MPPTTLMLLLLGLADPRLCAARLFLPHPVLLPEEMAALKSRPHRGWSAVTLAASFPRSAASRGWSCRGY